MRFIILRVLQHNELGMFHAYRRLGKETAKQRAINFDGDVVDRVFPAAKDTDEIPLALRYESDTGVAERKHRLKRQHKNWRLEGNCPEDHCYDFVEPDCLFAMIVDAGVNPAVGAWAVYPQDDPVTLAIRAHGESGGLTSHSMIALHEAEGRHALTLLRQSKPNLFPPEAVADAVRIAAGTTFTVTESGVHLPPDPQRLVRILASVGHSLPSAVADIVDNAISKDATDIRITFGRPDAGHGRWMAIRDNGIGMDASQLSEAMRIGSKANYDKDDLGKYGYGLKGASWSQTDCFTVASKQRDKPACHLTWDAAKMESWEAQSGPLETWVADATRIEDNGTCVLWRNMRPPKNLPVARGTDPHTAELQDLQRHLGLVFHRFLDGKAAGRKRVKISVSGTPVEPNDPVGHPRTTSYDRKTVRVPTSEKDAFVQIQAFLLPSEQEIKDLHGTDSDAARRDLDRIGMYGRRNESQGVYVYRNNRLIQWGGWHDMWSTTDEKTKLARVTVEFGSDLDDQFAVNISKRMVTLSQQLQEEIKKLAQVARNDSKKKYLPPKPNHKSSSPISGTSHPSTTTHPSPISAELITPATRPVVSPTGKVPPRLPVRTVRTRSFAWKIASNITGEPELQVNEEEQQLSHLLQAITRDPYALSSLIEFLERLDKAGVQKLLMEPEATL